MAEKNGSKPTLLVEFEDEDSLNCKVVTHALDPMQLAAAVRLLDELCSLTLRDQIIFDRSKTRARVLRAKGTIPA